jgi:16S rRNA (guanine527-N7)-methyltransferase
MTLPGVPSAAEGTGGQKFSNPTGHSRDKLDAYLDLLEKWNRVYNLTALRRRAEMETLHVQDAWAVLPWLPDRTGLRLLDVGSGPGVPGIPLALARPDAQFVLLDANSKKTAFLAQAVIELGLRNARVVTARIEDFRPPEPFDVVIARAFSDLRTLALAAEPVLAPHGRIVAMKGVVPHDEIAALPPGIRVVETPSLDVPGLVAERHLVIMQRKQETTS